MKHVFGYGLLTVALVGALVWGFKRSEPRFVAPGWVKSRPDPLEIDLRDKHPEKGGHEVSDHPDDYALDVKEIIWKTSETFDVKFDAASPCSGPITYTDDGKTFQASCPVTTSNTAGQYSYKIHFPNGSLQGGIKTGGITTCDGCVIDLDSNP